MKPLQALTNSLSLKLGMGDNDGQELVNTLKATAFRQVEVSDAQMMALMVVANQYGLNPWTKEIYAFPDKNNGIVPVVGVDGWSRIINTHDQFDGMSFSQSGVMITMNGAKSPAPEWIECTIHRKDRSHPVTVREYLDEVYREPFKSQKGYVVDGPWQSHPKRFLRHKAMIQCARLAFGFVGVYDQDEAERIIEKDVTPEFITSAKGAQIEAVLSRCSEQVREWFASKYESTTCIPSSEFDGLMVALRKRAKENVEITPESAEFFGEKND